MNLALGSAPAAQPRYSTAGFPTLLVVAVLDRLATAADLDRVALLHDDSAGHCLKKAQGDCPRPISADPSTSDRRRLAHVRS